MFVSSAQLAFDIAERRIEALTSESEAFARRDVLRSELEARGLSAVATHELRLLEEACSTIEAGWARERAEELSGDLSWLREEESYWQGGEAAVS